MNGHVTDRLSAFLDDELAGAEREAVARHLEACAECTRFLEELAAVDRLAAAEPVPVPDAYFDGFVSRVRSRIRQAPGAARPRGVLPGWALAAAAVLVVALVAPLLLLRQKAADAPSLSALEQRQAPAAAPAARPAPATLVPAAPPVTSLPDSRLGALGYVQEGKREARRDQSAEGAPKKDKAQANAAAELQTKEEVTIAAQARVPPPAAAEPGRFRDEKLSELEADAAAPGPQGADRIAPQAAAASESGFAEAPAESARAQDESAPSAGVAGGLAGAAPSPAPAPMLRKSTTAPSAAFRALAARPAATIAEARGLREAWRAFAGGASGSEADAARVRVIETGLLAYRLSAEASDLDVARRDAAAYLKREDAAQKDRVRALVAAAR